VANTLLVGKARVGDMVLIEAVGPGIYAMCIYAYRLYARGLLMPDTDTGTPTPPLTAKVFAILLAFADGSAHGYQVKSAVERQSNGAIRIDAGSLYRTIAQLVEEGLLRESIARPDPESDDVRRRYYELTASGREALAAEATRLADVVAIARRHKLIGHAPVGR
jgi:DNA-binding PadR family transcriptional regulator